MAFPPTSLRISCNKCHTSVTWNPRSDALDPSEHLTLIRCAKCGSEDIERKPFDKTHATGVVGEMFSWFKKQLGS